MSLIINGIEIPSGESNIIINDTMISEIHTETILKDSFGFLEDNDSFGFGTLSDSLIGGSFIGRESAWTSNPA